MLDWEDAQRKADEMAAAIRDTVLELGETVVTGNVRATYRQGRKRYDYKGAADGHPMVSEPTVELFTKTKVTVDWRGICDHVGIEKDEIPFSQGDPSVSLKIEEA
jgi:hypothetical protein